MANVDGDVKIRVSLDSKGVDKGADRVKQKMASLSKNVAKTFSKTAQKKEIEQTIAGYEEQARAVEKNIRAEQELISLLKKLRKEVEYDPQARDMADQMGIEDFDQSIDASYNKISELRKELRNYNSEIRNGGKSLKDIEDGSNATTRAIKNLGDRMSRLARRIFVFNVAMRALEAMRKGLVNLLSQDSAVAKSMAQIKGSLYAAFMPIYNFILPAIRTLLNFLAQLASAIASIIGGLFGISNAALKNAGALNQQAGATGAAGSAAKKAAKSIAAFDEINQLSDDSSGGGGGGGGGGTGMDFSGLDEVSDRMKTIAKLVLAIGAGIGAWRIAKALGALKDASLLRNIGFIAGAALTIWAVLDLIVPAVRDIAENGPDMENILKLIGGIAFLLGGVSLMMGSVGGGLGWIAIGIGALIAANWDEVTNALSDWDTKITAMVEDVPVLKKAYEGFKTLVVSIVDGFKELAGIITKLATEPLSMDLLAEIGDMSFTSKAIASVVTAKLLTTIGKLFGMKGTIGIGTTGAIVFALGAAIDIATDVFDIIQGDAQTKEDATMELITKLLFGAVAAVITVVAGGGGFALLYTVPIGIQLAKTIFSEGEAETNYDEQILDAVNAAKSAEELRAAIESITNLQVTDEWFKKFIAPNVPEGLENTELGLVELKKQAEAFVGIFMAKSGEDGFEEWLKTLGLLGTESSEVSNNLSNAASTMESVSEKASETKTAVSNLSNQIDETPDMTVDTTSLENMESASETLQTDVSSVETAFKDAETAAKNMTVVLDEDMSTAYSDMQTEATQTGTAMTNTFAIAAARIKNALVTNWNGVFKSFSKGGEIFKGIETGIETVFKQIVNHLIDGINSVLSSSFGKINDALDDIRNTRIDGVKPFIGVPRVSVSKIPKLAQGAVIPANNEFLAILGDQKSGTNIEAPLDTIVEAMMVAMAKSGMDGSNLASAVRSAITGLSLKVGKTEIGHVVADAINSNRRAEGKLALNL